ncbi:MAG: hypothetical protein ACREQ8_17505 [Woeseiaceae bacterium]
MHRYFSLSILAALAACSAPVGPEQAVRNWLEAAEEAVENEDRSGLVDLISENYTDARGNDRQAIDQRLRVYFLRNQNIVLATRIEELTILGDTAARLALTAGMAGRNNGVFDWNVDAHRFELELEYDEDRWLLIGARWAESGAELH